MYKNQKEYVASFFDSLHMDTEDNHEYEVYIKEATFQFLMNPNNDTAFEVYNIFFDIYKVGSRAGNTFIDLLDVLKNYEEGTAKLSYGQRDHYVHSVNVFVLGLSIYANNSTIKKAFRDYYSKNEYKKRFSTNEEEFFFTWGITSLYHDIGYPVEIIYKQLCKFVSIVDDDDYKEINPYIEYGNFEILNTIQVEGLIEEGNVDRTTDLISNRIVEIFDVDKREISEILDTFVKRMQTYKFVDHGFYSALIVGKWYGELLLTNNNNNDTFYYQIVDGITSIFLHNGFKNVLRKSPINRPKLLVSEYPLAYMIILCDELQEWNRRAFGASNRTFVDGSAMEIDDNRLRIHYISQDGILGDSFVEKKFSDIDNLLDLRSAFESGCDLSANIDSRGFISKINQDKILPRMMIEKIEELAKLAHDDYNKNQMERNPGKELEYPNWDSLPDSLKYSNIRQIRDIPEKLKILGCYADIKKDGEKEYQISNDDIEILARIEHDSWVNERTEQGWKYGSEKDVEKKVSPYILPYDDLAEKIKELDRDTIRNIPLLLSRVNLHIYKI